MTSLVAPPAPPSPASRRSTGPGLVLVGLGVASASVLAGAAPFVPLIVAALLVGAVVGNGGLAGGDAAPGVAFASTVLLRAGIVLLGLRLSLGELIDLGLSTLAIIALTVSITFVAVQAIGRRLGLSAGLSLMAASGFSICGNSAIASVKGVSDAEEEEVAAAIGLVTLFGTAAVFALPVIGGLVGLTETQLGIWFGASVQDTAQVIAVGSATGPAVLAVATAVKLTRVLLLAPIVAGLSLRNRAHDGRGKRPSLVPLFVGGFLAAMMLRTSGLLPSLVLDAARTGDHYLLAAGIVGLGTSVRMRELRRLGVRPLVLGLLAWMVVGGVSLGLVAGLG